MWSRSFWLALAERAIKTLAQAAAALLVASGTGLIDADWLGIASASGMAALVSVLTSLGSNAITGNGPSITDAEQVVPTVLPVLTNDTPDGPDTMTVGG